MTFDEQVNNIVSVLWTCSKNYEEADDNSLIYLMDNNYDRNAIERAMNILKEKFNFGEENMSITQEQVLAAAEAMFNLSTHYYEDISEVQCVYTWENFHKIGKNTYIKQAEAALNAAEKLRNS